VRFTIAMTMIMAVAVTVVVDALNDCGCGRVNDKISAVDVTVAVDFKCSYEIMLWEG